MSNAVKEIIDDMVAAWVDHERTEDDDDKPDPDLEEAFRHDCERLLLAQSKAVVGDCAAIADQHAEASCSGTGSETDAMRLGARSIAMYIREGASTITPALDAAIQDEIEHGPKDISR